MTETGNDNPGSQREDALERLLRSHGRHELSPQFRQNVMHAISRLPEPQLTARPRGLAAMLYAARVLSAGEKVGAAVILLALASLLLPGGYELLTWWGYELEAMQLSLSVGENVLSASLLSIVVVSVSCAFIAGIGAYSARNHLISA